MECRAVITRQGRRSVTVDTHLIAENLLDGARTHCLSGEFVMVRQAHESLSSIPLPIAESLKQDNHSANTLANAMVAEIVFPGHANHRGVLHGGPAMEWMTKAGFVAATRQVRRTVVMASSEKLDFNQSAYVGDVVEVTAQVTSTGNRSIQVQVSMWAESPESGERRLCASGKFVYVAVEN